MFFLNRNAWGVISFIYFVLMLTRWLSLFKADVKIIIKIFVFFYWATEIIILTHFQPMFHLCRNQLVGFY